MAVITCPNCGAEGSTLDDFPLPCKCAVDRDAGPPRKPVDGGDERWGIPLDELRNSNEL